MQKSTQMSKESKLESDKKHWYYYDTSSVSSKDYVYAKWNEVFPDYKVNLYSLLKSGKWLEIFKLFDKDIKEVEENFDIMLKNTDGGISILPHPHLVFNTFNLLDITGVKVVILGQDPYKNIKNGAPEAVGMSFSIPKYTPIPSSLKNIFKNLKKYKHIAFEPKHGDLSYWNLQGCLMLNTALTLQQELEKSHLDIWTPFTDNIIKYLSKNCDHVVFVLWGRPALNKKRLIDHKKHKVIVSSHPSGLSCAKPLGDYGAFNDTDVFGMINKELVSWKKTPINWQTV